MAVVVAGRARQSMLVGRDGMLLSHPWFQDAASRRRRCSFRVCALFGGLVESIRVTDLLFFAVYDVFCACAGKVVGDAWLLTAETAARLQLVGALDESRRPHACEQKKTILLFSFTEYTMIR